MHRLKVKQRDWKTWIPLLWVIVVMGSGFLLSSQAMAATQPTLMSGTNEADIPACGANDNPEYCLPIGRWGGVIGSLSTRNDRADGVMAVFAVIGNRAQYMFNSLIPQIILTLTQACWNVSIALTSFSVHFKPLQEFGKYIDQFAGQTWGFLTDLHNGLLAILVLSLLMMLVGWMGFNMNNNGSIGKRISVSLLCIATVGAMGIQAGKDQNANTPVTGSPWWVVTTINKAWNTVATGLAYKDTGKDDSTDGLLENSYGAGTYDCSDYLKRMNRDYEKVSDKNNVMATLNTMWVETALRSYITAQFSNPSVNGAVGKSQAQDARYIYCHILDNAANTDPLIQRDLTVPEGHQDYISDETAQYIFTPQGYIEPWDSAVHNDEKAVNTSPEIARHRAGIFWGLCGYKKATGNAYARNGWSDIVKKMSHAGEVGGNGTYLRASWDPGWFGNNGSLGQSPLGEKKIISKEEGVKVNEFCSALLQNKNAVYGSDNEANLKTSADVGWTVDIPNVSAGFEAAGFNDPKKMSNRNAKAARNVVYTQYGVVGRDISGMWGSLFASVANMVVWVLLAVIYVFSKFTVVGMGLSLMFVMLARAIPFGGFDDAPKRWFKKLSGAFMVSVLYSLLGSIDQMVIRVFAKILAPQSGGFIYNLLIGLAPVVGLALIGQICQALGKGNPFSMKAMVGSVAGGGALAMGLSKLKGSAAGLAKSSLKGLKGGVSGMKRGLSRAARGVKSRVQGSRSVQARHGQGNQAAQRAMQAQHMQRVVEGEKASVNKPFEDMFHRKGAQGIHSAVEALPDGRHKYVKGEVQGTAQRTVASQAVALKRRANNLRAKASLLAERGHGVKARVASIQSGLADSAADWKAGKLSLMRRLQAPTMSVARRADKLEQLRSVVGEKKQEQQAAQARLAGLQAQASHGGSVDAAAMAQAQDAVEQAQANVAEAQKKAEKTQRRNRKLDSVAMMPKRAVGQAIAHQSLGRQRVRQAKFAARADWRSAKDIMGW